MNGRRGRRSDRASDPRRRAVLAELDGADHPLHLRDLAERLVKRDESVLGVDEYHDRLERRLISLRHDTLPRLAASGVVDFDLEENTVSSLADEVVDVEWREGESANAVLAAAGADVTPESAQIGVVDGREAVIQQGRALADEAENELFCLFVGTDLLEEECVRRAGDAIDRGVSMYVGSRDQAVRDLLRRDLPGATFWEPRRGWIDAPPGFPKVGRLVLVDRRKVMLAVLEEPDADGTYPEETAIVGEGVDHPLVVLVRELLGPRLDHLDHQSGNFQNELHT